MASQIDPSKQRFLDSPAAQIIRAAYPSMSLEEVLGTVERTQRVALEAHGEVGLQFFDTSKGDSCLKIVPVRGEVLSLELLQLLKGVQVKILKKHGQADGEDLPPHIEEEIKQVSGELIKKANERNEQGKPFRGVCGYEDCLVFERLKKCGRCLNIFYCSVDHQRLDWKRHKVKCLSPS